MKKNLQKALSFDQFIAMHDRTILIILNNYIIRRRSTYLYAHSHTSGGLGCRLFHVSSPRKMYKVHFRDGAMAVC